MKYKNIVKNDQPTADVKHVCVMLNHIWTCLLWFTLEPFFIHHLPQHLLMNFKE